MDILNLFEYKDGDLIICEKWAINTSLGKKVGKGVYIDKIYYKKEEIDSFKDIYINSSGDIELLSKTFNLEIKTVKSRIYKMGLNKKYGKPKRLNIQKSEV